MDYGLLMHYEVKGNDDIRGSRCERKVGPPINVHDIEKMGDGMAYKF